MRPWLGCVRNMPTDVPGHATFANSPIFCISNTFTKEKTPLLIKVENQNEISNLAMPGSTVKPGDLRRIRAFASESFRDTGQYVLDETVLKSCMAV